MCGGGRGRERQTRRGMLCKQPGFIVTSHVTFTAGWQVFRRDRKEDGAGPLTLVTDGGEEDGKGELICGVEVGAASRGWGFRCCELQILALMLICCLLSSVT